MKLLTQNPEMLRPMAPVHDEVREIKDSVLEIIARIDALQPELAGASRRAERVTGELLVHAFSLGRCAFKDRAEAEKLAREVLRRGIRVNNGDNQLARAALSLAIPKRHASPAMFTKYSKALGAGWMQNLGVEQFRDLVFRGSHNTGGINQLAKAYDNMTRAAQPSADLRHFSTICSGELAMLLLPGLHICRLRVHERGHLEILALIDGPVTDFDVDYQQDGPQLKS